MNQKGIDTFNDGVQALLLAQPFFGTLLMKLKHVPEQGCPTLYVDGQKIGYGPDFMAQQTAEQAMFCVAHEVLHQAWGHVPRLKHYMDSGIGPDGHPLDWDLFQQAMDYPNNASLVESGIGKVPAGINICLDQSRFPSSMTPEEVYCILKKNGNPNPQQQPLDEHRTTEDDPTLPPAITAADVIQAANVCKAMRGTLPAGIDRLLGEIKKPTSSPWRRLRQGVVSSMAGYDQTTWRRLNRKMITRGVGYPGKVAEGAGIIGIIGDTSGSIGQKMLDLFGGHMAAIMDDARPQSVRVYWTDAAVHRVDVVKNSTQLRLVMSKKIPGGGGTDMPVGVLAAEADGCDVIVVLTDGYTPFGKPSKVPVYWAITEPGKKSPHGTTIHIA